MIYLINPTNQATNQMSLPNTVSSQAIIREMDLDELELLIADLQAPNADNALLAFAIKQYNQQLGTDAE